MGMYGIQILEGRMAFAGGLKLQNNPYRADGDNIEASKFFSWAYGWVQQKDKTERMREWRNR